MRPSLSFESASTFYLFFLAKHNRPQTTEIRVTIKGKKNSVFSTVFPPTPLSSTWCRVCTEPRDPDATPAVNLNSRFGSRGGGGTIIFYLFIFSLSLSLSSDKVNSRLSRRFASTFGRDGWSPNKLAWESFTAGHLAANLPSPIRSLRFSVCEKGGRRDLKKNEKKKSRCLQFKSQFWAGWSIPAITSKVAPGQVVMESD